MRATRQSNRVTAQPGAIPSKGTADDPAEARYWKIATILVPVDFSAGSRAAYECALELAEQHNARVHLLHVVDGLHSPEFRGLPLGLTSDAVIAHAKKELVAFAQSGSHPVVPVYPEVRDGSPWEEIIRAAEEDKIDLIVLPTHGYTGLKRLMIGSVAERVVRYAPCLVLTLRQKGRSRPARGHRRRARTAKHVETV